MKTPPVVTATEWDAAREQLLVKEKELTRARDAVRALKREQGGSLKQPVTIRLRGGTYALSEHVTFTPEDSGTEKSPTISPQRRVPSPRSV